jgi:hypothetical protein
MREEKATSWAMPIAPCPRGSMTPSALHVARCVEQAFGLPLHEFLRKGFRPRNILGMKARVALSTFYWASIVFTKLSTKQVGRCVGRDRSSVVKTSRLVMAAAFFEGKSIPTKDLQDSLQWIAENITSLPTHVESRVISGQLLPVKVAR